MLNRPTILILLIVSVTQLFAQTESFTISWDLNTEPDIYNYQVYRGTSPGTTNQISVVQHPGNEYTDNDIEKGVQYYYRLRARDISANQSDYSEDTSNKDSTYCQSLMVWNRGSGYRLNTNKLHSLNFQIRV